MATALRATGIDVVGHRPWGTHFCHFYETTDDLLDMLVPYFRAGLESREFCVWLIADPLTEADARRALGHSVTSSGDIEILPAGVVLRGHYLRSQEGAGWLERQARRSFAPRL